MVETISFEEHEQLHKLISGFHQKVIDKAYSGNYNGDVEGAFKAALAEELKLRSTPLHPDGHYKVCHNCDTVLERKNVNDS